MLEAVDWKQQLMMVVYCGHLCICVFNTSLHLAMPTLWNRSTLAMLAVVREIGIYVTILTLATVVHKTPDKHPYGVLLWMMRVVALYDLATQIIYLQQVVSN